MSPAYGFRHVGVRGNFIMQVTIFPWCAIRILIDHCRSTKLWFGDPAELAIERQPGSGACSSLTRTNTGYSIPLQLPLGCTDYVSWLPMTLNMEKFGRQSLSVPAICLLTILWLSFYYPVIGHGCGSDVTTFRFCLARTSGDLTTTCQHRIGLKWDFGAEAEAPLGPSWQETCL